MEICWHPDPTRRPSFQQIIPLLDSVIVDILISDPDANKFWKSAFLGRDHVNWTEFFVKFANLLKISDPNPKDLNFLCLKKILVTHTLDSTYGDVEVVKLDKFAHLLNWFGPVNSISEAPKEQKGIQGLLDRVHDVFEGGRFTILDKIRVLMQKEWFHGDISKEASEDLLSGQPKGTFLVRTSITEKNSPFTISKVTKTGGKINHQRIQKRNDGKYEVTIKFSTGKTQQEISKDDLLVPFIKSLSQELYLVAACPGSKFKALFLSTKLEGYLATDDD